MTKPSPSGFTVLDDFRIAIYAKMFRTSSNTGGKVRLGLGGRRVNFTEYVNYWPSVNLGTYNYSYVDVDVSNYPTNQWQFLEFHILITDLILAGTTYLQTSVSPVADAPITGGPVYISDFYIFEEQAGPEISQNSQTASYTLQLSDSGKHVYITTGGVTVPPNSDVNFGIGTVVSIVNASGSTQTITAGSGVTLRLSGTATTGNRTLAAYGIATLLKVDTDTWNATGNVT